jgi:hypothetical protein
VPETGEVTVRSIRFPADVDAWLRKQRYETDVNITQLVNRAVRQMMEAGRDHADS